MSVTWNLPFMKMKYTGSAMINSVANNYDVNFMYNQAAPQEVQQQSMPPKTPHHQDKSKQIAQKTSAIASAILLISVIAYYLKCGKSAPKSSSAQAHACRNLSLLG